MVEAVRSSASVDCVGPAARPEVKANVGRSRLRRRVREQAMFTASQPVGMTGGPSSHRS